MLETELRSRVQRDDKTPRHRRHGFSRVAPAFRATAPLFLYGALQLLLSPFLVGRFFRHVFYKRRDYVGWPQRLGLRPALTPEQARFFGSAQPRVWLFCRSLGEYRAAAPLLKALLTAEPEAAVLLFSITDEVPPAVAQQMPIKRVFTAYLPYDWLVPSWVHLRAAPPDLLLFVESFWYPNLLPLARARGARAVVLNFTVKPVTFRHTRRFTFRAWLRHAVDLFCVQGEADAAALARLGCPAQQLVVAGNAKFDVAPVASDRRGLDALRSELGAGQALLVAGSTHEGEEAPVLDAFARVRQERPDAQLIVAPRYARGLEPIAAKAAERGLRYALRTRAPHVPGSWDVLLLDTVGELARVYALGRAAFVGGSFVPVGGHNLVEPIAAGVPTFFGPHIAAFRAVAADAQAAGVAQEVADSEALARAWLRALDDPEYRRDVADRCGDLLRRNRGATRRWLEALGRLGLGAE